MTVPPSRRLAILIDAENVSAACWPAATVIVGQFGAPVIVRAYVCHPPAPGWAGAAGVEMIDGRPASGPNAADFVLAMDAAVLAAAGHADIFVLITGDDGFAAVAYDLRRRGVLVYALLPLKDGMVPRRLAAAADLAILLPEPAPVAGTGAALSAGPPGGPPTPPTLPGASAAPALSTADALEARILEVLAACPPDLLGGWISLSTLGIELKRAGISRPKGRLSDLMSKLDSVEFKGKKGGNAFVRPRGWVPADGEEYAFTAGIDGDDDERAVDDDERAVDDDDDADELPF